MELFVLWCSQAQIDRNNASGDVHVVGIMCRCDHSGLFLQRETPTHIVFEAMYDLQL